MSDISSAKFPEDITLTAAHELMAPLMRAIGKNRHERELIDIHQASGRILAEDVASTINIPGHDTAAVDGYAFYFSDLEKILPVIGSIKAGHPFNASAAPGKAYRIFTGAIMPEGPDTVAMQENCSLDINGHVILPKHLKRGANYRPKGENIAKGEIALREGTTIGAVEIGLAAAMGYANLNVQPKLKVALISMGDEVIDIVNPNQMDRGTIFDSNRPMLTAMMQDIGHEVIDYGILADNHDTLSETFTDASKNADVILCSGGSSEGDEDHTKSAILSSRGVIDFWRLALKPGRPLVSGRIGDVPIFGLPGNPVASFVCTRLYVAPMMAIMQNGDGRLPPKITVSSGFTKHHKKGRTEYLRARLDDDGKGGKHAVLNGRPGAGVLSSLTGSDGLVEIPEDHDDVKIGDQLPFFIFREAAL